ncbi:MAG: hypothetical protein IT193_01285 [Propionibacteriaceae bacterium]|nr:hypothetical protein [Propionibacteriaceae bacterium]
MAEESVLEFKSPAEHAPRNAGADSPVTWGHDLDPQQVTLAARAICNSEHDVHCGLSIVPDGRAPETIAATDDVPVRVDWLQHELRQGPGLDADLGEVLAIKDLAAAERWLDFGRMCEAVMDLRSMVSIRIPTGSPDRAMLNFYSSDPGAFDQMDIEAALKLARLAAPAVLRIIDDFREPLQDIVNGDCSRVAVAVGTVMARYRVNSADAFGLLREASGYLRRSLLGVAIDVVADVRLLEEAVIQARRQRRSSPGRAPSQPGAPPGVGSGQPATPGQSARLRPSANDAPSIGGPEMWHDPSAPPARLAGIVPGGRGGGRRSPWRPVLPA